LLLLEEVKKEDLVSEEYIFSEEFQKIYNTIYEHNYKNKEELYSILKENSEVEETFEGLIFDLSDMPTNPEEIAQEIEIIKKRLRENYLRNQQKEISVKIAMAEERNEEKEIEKYMKEMAEINKLLQK
jgi:hypothetical protein